MRDFYCLSTALEPPAISAEAPAKWQEAPLYQPQLDLVEAMQIAIAMRQPLLLTGEPGCGKTSAAYWAAWRLGLTPEQLIHAQVRSDASAARLKYEFDAVKYLRESQVAALRSQTFDEDLRRFIQPGPLWHAFAMAERRPCVLLLDEIDKAPRDLPNDLLHEFDELAFDVPDWPLPNGGARWVGRHREAGGELTLLVLTSNGERQLPDPFLRRCVHHNLRFDARWLGKVVHHRMERGELKLTSELVDHALKRFVQLRALPGLRHRPGLSELLVWLKTIALVGNMDPKRLSDLDLSTLPYLGTLIKDRNDRELVDKDAPGELVC